ncbi:MAG: polysaccharide biosynthesis/export family protein [Armatimonadota bacterium]
MKYLINNTNDVKKSNISKIVLLFASVYFLLNSIAYAQNNDVYLLGPEDTIMVTVIGHPDFSGEFYVPSDGTITLPVAGKITVTGKTIGVLTAEVIEKLKERLNEPEIVVSLKSPRMQRIYVMGAVAKSDSYDMKPGWRITEALAAAGGLEKGISPEDCRVIVFRSSSGGKQTVLLADVLRGSSDANLQISNGDVMTIDPGETFPVYVTGKVKSPGLYRIRKDNPGIMSAITMAGGILDESASNSIKLNHTDGTSEMINLTPVLLEGNGLPVSADSGEFRHRFRSYHAIDSGVIPPPVKTLYFYAG